MDVSVWVESNLGPPAAVKTQAHAVISLQRGRGRSDKSEHSEGSGQSATP